MTVILGLAVTDLLVVEFVVFRSNNAAVVSDCWLPYCLLIISQVEQFLNIDTWGGVILLCYVPINFMETQRAF